MKKNMFMIFVLVLFVAISAPAFSADLSVTPNGDGTATISIPVTDSQSYANRKACWMDKVQFYANTERNLIDGTVSGNAITATVKYFEGKPLYFTALICEQGVHSAWFAEQYSYDVEDGKKTFPQGFTYVPHDGRGGNFAYLAK